jgi:hypothetical protein
MHVTASGGSHTATVVTQVPGVSRQDAERGNREPWGSWEAEINTASFEPVRETNQCD